MAGGRRSSFARSRRSWDRSLLGRSPVPRALIPRFPRTAATRDDTGSRQLPVLKILARVWAWNALPNGRHAYFYNIWACHRLGRQRFRARLRDDLSQVLRAMAEGYITAQIAARFPLARAADALCLAESGTVAGKIVLTP